MSYENQIPESISKIAAIVHKDWQNIHFAARPYLEAMASIDRIEDQYLEDSASSIVTYFLANAQSWRGEVARAVKGKLNALLKSKR